jgi:hypothetical protein
VAGLCRGARHETDKQINVTNRFSKIIVLDSSLSDIAVCVCSGRRPYLLKFCNGSCRNSLNVMFRVSELFYVRSTSVRLSPPSVLPLIRDDAKSETKHFKRKLGQTDVEKWCEVS